jgi:hypothetical protein
MLKMALHHPAWRGIALAASLTALATSYVAPARAQTIPQDAKHTCTVPRATFASWLQSGTPQSQRALKPPDSVHFPQDPKNCRFYQWAEQTFLWLTSPAPSAGGSHRTVDTTIFYDVSPPDPTTQLRTLREHKPGALHEFDVRAAQVGPRGLPVIFSKAGQMLEIERPQPAVSAQVRIRNSKDELVEVAHAERSPDGALTLRDAAGATIEPGPAPATASILVHQFIIGGVSIFLDRFSNLIDVEQGQVDGSVLQAQNGSLIYYGIMVNDVYAVFQAGVKHEALEKGKLFKTFPISVPDRDAITNYASMYGRTLADADALAIEVKTSWVEADRLPNKRDYITVKAWVPKYDTSTKPNAWVPTGRKKKTLALIGMHVVGSVFDHSEMIWATFEHFGNTRNAKYKYRNRAGIVSDAPQSTGGRWLFSASNATGKPNQAHMKMVGDEIHAVESFSISPSDTIRWKPWGAASNLSPNMEDPTPADSNTEVISINNSVRRKMKGDVRSNYFLVGATWTDNHAPEPNGSAPTPEDPGNQVGTSQLANSTMETYQQGPDRTASRNSNCFYCHTSSAPLTPTTALSHIFDCIKPLF